MEDFLAGKTNVSPLTGRMLRQKEADQLRSALTCRPDDPIGAVLVSNMTCTQKAMANGAIRSNSKRKAGK